MAQLTDPGNPDKPFFPAVTDGRSTYTSPLADILKELRRKNAVAAAAAATTTQHMSVIKDTDSEENHDGDTCACQSPRRDSFSLGPKRRSSLFGGASFGREESTIQLSEISQSSTGEKTIQLCPNCGKKEPFDPIGEVALRASRNQVYPRRTSHTARNRPETELTAPQHARALLQSTPHLRHLSPTSLDMQGSGNLTSSRSILSLVTSSPAPASSAERAQVCDYRTCLARNRANQEAASELASFLWVLAHEMSPEEYGAVESEVFTSIFAMLHSTESARRLAGAAALDALIDTPSADDEKKAIKFGNNLKFGLQAPQGGYEFLSALSTALGHMAMRAANVDLVEAEVTRALEWLGSPRSSRRLAACLTLREIAKNAPTAFFSITSQNRSASGGTSHFLDHIFPVIRDVQPIVRACAADALSWCLKVLVDRQQLSLTGMLCRLYFDMMEDLQYDPTKKRKTGSQSVLKTDAANHGSLLVVSCMLEYSRDFMLPRFDEVCLAVLTFREHPMALIRLEVVRLLPRLARRYPGVFGRRYLDDALLFLLKSASTPTPPRVGIDLRPTAFTSIGQLVLAMSDSATGTVIGGDALPTIKILENPNEDLSPIIEVSKTGIIYDKLQEIFSLVRRGLQRSRPNSSSRGVNADTRSAALNCGADLVEALGSVAHPYIPDLINDMFASGLSSDLIKCLHAVAQCVPSQQSVIEDHLLQEVSLCLAGTPSAKSICNPLSVFGDYMQTSCGSTAIPSVQINMSDRQDVVQKVVLSLRTLGLFGDISGTASTSNTIVPLLPFVRHVAARYLTHPSSEVRREAALTCCSLLVAREIDMTPSQFLTSSPVSSHMTFVQRLGGASGRVIEEVLAKLLQTAVSDPSPIVRLCVVLAFNSRFDYFLCQAHHLQALCLVLQDEALATRAAALKLLGRLARDNPAIVLPAMRSFLVYIMTELRCGGDTGRGREEATRLLKVFLRTDSFNRLVQPVLPSVVEALPLRGVAPRLASAALEALGELAQASRFALRPWVPQLIPHILETMQDHSSASKQRISLRTLGQIAGSTGYVISPYLDYPQLLSQATDVLPGTKRAPWVLRREVIRTLGILGALDPDHYHTSVPKTSKGGAVGGGYFIEQEGLSAAVFAESTKLAIETVLSGAKADEPIILPLRESSGEKRASSESISEPGHFVKEADDDMPVYLYMYEQYAMVAQPDASLPPQRRMTPADEDFYPTVTIQALTRIFKDSSLAVHHGMVMQAIMYIFESLDLRCVPYLKQVVPHMLYTIKNCNSSSLREALLKQVATLSGIVLEHLRPYVADIFDIVDHFWPSRHLETILYLISRIAEGVPDEFRRYVPRLVKRILASIEEIQVSDWLTPYSRADVVGSGPLEMRKLTMILRSVRSLQGVLGDFFHMLVPTLLRLAGSLLSANTTPSNGNPMTQSYLSDIALLTIETVSVLLEHDGPAPPLRTQSFTWMQSDSDSFPRGCSLPARAAQPLVRLLGPEANAGRVTGYAIIQALCVCAQRLGYKRWMSLYHEVARNAICQWQARVGLGTEGVSTRNNNSSQRDDLSLNGLNLYNQVVDSLERSHTRGSPSISFRLQSTQTHDSLLALRNGDEAVHLVDTIASFGDRSLATGGVDIALSSVENEFQSNPTLHPVPNNVRRHLVNQGNLQRAWDVSQRTSREDWDEWMRRFGLQLLREAPSPSLRATAQLAHAYQPLARELFSAAFFCCWEELSEQYRANLIDALEAAFVADISPEILQTLLNLAEFMEHDGVENGLPIDISILADLALKCRAYAKALHYNEREYNMGGADASCVETLISINNKLDLPEAALGVLKSARFHLEANRGSIGEEFSSQFLRHDQRKEMLYSVVYSTDESCFRSQNDGIPDFKESWLAKLGSWSEALVVYEEKLRQNPHDFDAILGSMRCLDATGEWQRVLDIAEMNWPAISASSGERGQEARQSAPHSFSSLYIEPRAKRKALKFCAQAAWRLGQWTELEKCASQLVKGNETSYAINTAARFGDTSGDGEDRVWVNFDGAFYTAVLHIHRKEWSLAASAIDAARMAMDSRFTALMAESYKRAYPGMVTAQMLAEMEEIISYRKLEDCAATDVRKHPANRADLDEARRELLSIWRDRLAGCRVDADAHSPIMAVRSLVLIPTDDVEATLTLSELSRQAHRFKLAERVLLDPLNDMGARLDGIVFGYGLPDSLILGISSQESGRARNINAVIDRLLTKDAAGLLPKYGSAHAQCSKMLVQEAGGLSRLLIQHRLYFAFVKHLRLLSSSDRRDEAMDRLMRLSNVVDLVSHCENVKDDTIQVACWLELGEWKLEQAASPSAVIAEQLQVEVLTAYKRAISSSSCGYKAWHAWALLNFRIAQQISERDDATQARRSSHESSRTLRNHIVAAVNGFVNAISLGTKRWSASVQQDMLNLLTCLFKYGELSEVATKINEGMGTITLDIWLGVLPQLLARIHIRQPSVRSVLHPLLTKLGEKHPQALMYPLSVLLKSPVIERKSAAESLMNSLKAHSSDLVEEALMVSSELIRVAILWAETWHNGLEDASRLYFGDGNVQGMLDVLLPLHEIVEHGPETIREQDFIRSFGRDLSEARAYVQEYVGLATQNGGTIPTQGVPAGLNQHDPSGRLIRESDEAESALNKAWDIYYTLFRRINKQLPELTKLELRQCSPALSKARTLELSVPGSYRVDGSYVKIEQFIPNVHVITSKQRPRKIILRGSDGQNYVFLLKGHEDLRQDERVMQLFGLVNALLARDRQTKKHDLNIQRYAISPLSHDCGVVGWVPHCDTLHSLIRDYRQGKIAVNMENLEMLKIAPDYDFLTVMQKVEVFTDGMKRTTGNGNDLYEILWLKSTNSEDWLEHRTKYTRSLAVMSMVGYILGLGDRHPSNLMLDKLSGRILHIDFGDCFEVAAVREKFPERVPFRLTRMLVKAMEVSGIEGSYRSTCERTMTVLRESRDSLVAMLEAFVYDPLISWRLAELSESASHADSDKVASSRQGTNSNDTADERIPDGRSESGRGPMNQTNTLLQDSIAEGLDEDGYDAEEAFAGEENASISQRLHAGIAARANSISSDAGVSASRARSLQMYSSMQEMSANLSRSSRIASIAGSESANVVQDGSMARSRIARSLRQRELMGLFEEESVNEKALKVIRRVQDKLSGTDFCDMDDTNEPLDVPDQVQRLIVQATSTENLCQLFIGWCAFW